MMGSGSFPKRFLAVRVMEGEMIARFAFVDGR